jgi:D-alanyl-D-alanine carboxypeptidase/D-alanyl-D-alanine-endopeptidase (penicillin-binding protein 4)
MREANQPKKATGGLGAFFRKHPRIWLISAGAVAFLLLGTAAVFAGVAAGSGAAGSPEPSESAAPPRPQPSEFPLASRLRTCSVTGVAANPALATLSGSVINANTGEVLFDRAGATPQRTASVLKLLTAAAAVLVLGPETQLSTRVIDGSNPGTIVLVGGGDPTLATTSNSYYQGAPLIADLAEAAMDRYEQLHPGIPITNIVLDATMWSTGDAWDPSWPTSERTQGYQAYVTALMVDGDRADPTEAVSPRSTDPVARAGQAFAAAADLDGVTFSTGSAVGSTVLAEVKSQPVRVLLDQMLKDSDNTIAENLARVVSKVAGLSGAAASLQQAITGALNRTELPPTTGAVIKDGSGLSDANAVSPQYVAELMVAIRAGTLGLGVVWDNLPVAGQSGDLADRFTGANAAAAGRVRAKPGWIDSQRSLAGIVDAADGTPLAFAFYAINPGGIPYEARAALDDLTTAVFNCGDNLSNN